MSRSEIHQALIAVLEDVKGMDRYKMRKSLVNNCLTQKEQAGLERDQDMRVDLRNIVPHFGYWGKLDVLIDWVEDIDSSPRIKSELDKILTRLGSKQQPKSQTPIPTTEDESPRQSEADLIEFDVFLAHNSQDKPLVEYIAEKLRQRGLNPWFDKWNLTPGRMFQEEIERILPLIKSMAVFVGPSGIGPWEQVEIRMAISQFVKRKLPVIPVLLPDVKNEPDLPLILQEFTWVRFSSGIDDPEALDNLKLGITGKHPRKS